MDTILWLGSLSLYQEYIARREAVDNASLLSYAEQDTGSTYNFELLGNIGVIDVTNTLTNDDSIFTALMGDTSYNQIRRGLIEAFSNPDVHAILLNIDSGGGTPAGLDDIARLVRQVTAAGKPVYAYSGGTMASAAYYLGAAAAKVYAGEMATVGSIGVLSIHKDMSAMYNKDGIDVTVFRSGTEKALSNPYEKLTLQAKEVIQERMDTLYNVFVNTVAEFRHVSPEVVLNNMANGREFIGRQALDAGLIDGVMPLDSLIAQLQSAIDTNIHKEITMRKKTTPVLSSAQLDMVMEGVAMEDALELAPSEVPTEVQAAEQEVEAVTELSIEPVKQPETIQSYLQSELSAKTAEVILLSTKVAEMEKELATFKAVHDPMKELVAMSITRMQIGLGAPTMDFSSMPAELLLAQHAKIREVFCNKMPVGGMAAIQVDEDEPTVSPSVDQSYKTRLHQNRI
jgi:signal peptide peptidase SppA